MRRLLIVAALAAFAGGCGDDEPSGEAEGPAPDQAGLSVELSETSVSPGGALAARVRNETSERFFYGAGYELDREVDGSFEPVDLPPRAVIQIALIAQPGKLGPPVEVKVPKAAEPGTWRVVLLRDVPDTGDLAAEFEVRGD